MQFKLRDLIQIKNGKDYSHLKEGNIPVYGTGGIFTYVNDYLYDGEALLLPRKGSLNNIMYTANQKFWSVDTMFYAVKKANASINLKYLYYVLSLVDISKLDIGSTVPSMTTELYYQLKIDLPSLETQDKVVKILSAIDNQISLNQNTINKLQILILTTYSAFYESSEMPNGKLRDICKLLHGYNFKPEQYVVSGKYDLITIKNVKGIFVDTGKVDKIDKLPDKMKNYCLLNSGDVLMSLTGNVGRLSIVTEANDLLNQRLCLLDTCNGYKTYVYSLLNSQKYQTIMLNLARGTSQKNLSPIDVENLPIYIPTNIEMFNDLTSPYFVEMLNIQKETNKLLKLKNNLLPILIN